MESKVGCQMDKIATQFDGNNATIGSYGTYDDFEPVSLSSEKIEANIVVHPDSIIDSSGPLSPDACSAFSRADPHAACRNEEIKLATENLLEIVIPKAALEMSAVPITELQDLDIVVFLHSRGINMRHLGYLRSCIPATKENFGARLKILVEVISRTLKNLLRDFQRRWMRSEKSTSEEGMLNLITHFLNLIVGSNVNSAEFWTERVIIGMIQRFGRCIWFFSNAGSAAKVSLSDEEIMEEIESLRSSPHFLQVLFWYSLLF